MTDIRDEPAGWKEEGHQKALVFRLRSFRETGLCCGTLYPEISWHLIVGGIPQPDCQAAPTALSYGSRHSRHTVDHPVCYRFRHRQIQQAYSQADPGKRRSLPKGNGTLYDNML